MMDWAISQHRPTVLAHAAVSLSHAIAREMMGNSMKVSQPFSHIGLFNLI